jgi:hypothetical protein
MLGRQLDAASDPLPKKGAAGVTCRRMRLDRAGYGRFRADLFTIFDGQTRSVSVTDQPDQGFQVRKLGVSGAAMFPMLVP